MIGLPDEKVVLKHRYSAFYNTDLETVLRCLEVEDVVVTGVRQVDPDWPSFKSPTWNNGGMACWYR